MKPCADLVLLKERSTCGFEVTRKFRAIKKDEGGIYGHSSFEVNTFVKVVRINKKRSSESICDNFDG